jgi:hypothetical protein
MKGLAQHKKSQRSLSLIHSSRDRNTLAFYFRQWQDNSKTVPSVAQAMYSFSERAVEKVGPSGTKKFCQFLSGSVVSNVYQDNSFCSPCDKA